MMRLHAPAKVNLFLRVLERRTDGYHNIQTLFQLIDLCDEITIEEAAEFTYSDNTAEGLGDDHLCLRAWQLLCKRHPACPAVRIRLTKRIPIGGGLGGGSSDAAAVLRGLNHHWQLGHSTEELAAMARTLGADVPLFVHGRTAFGAGIGDELTPTAGAAGQVFVIVPPRTPLATAAAYQALPPAAGTPLAAPGREYWGENTFESWACTQDPALTERLNRLREAGIAGLTGTGGAVYACCADGAAAGALLAQCPPEWQGTLATGLEYSPLLEETA